MAIPDDPSAVITFGPFQIIRRLRLVLREGHAIAVGGRAFDLLLAFVRSPDIDLREEELVRQAWPGRVVEKNTLHVQISELRRALAPERSLIVTVPGVGYRFTGDVQISVTTKASGRAGGLKPGPLLRTMQLVGRDGEVAEAMRLVMANRVVTVTGPGGCGKTELAYELVRQLSPGFPDGRVHAIEVEEMADQGEVGMAVAACFEPRALGHEVSSDTLNSLIGEPRALLLLDGCDHLIDAVAEVAEVANRTGPNLSVIATSRAPLRVEGEAVFRLGPLAIPEEGTADADDLLAAGSVQLFVSRALAVEPRFALDGASLSLIASICRRLDGIPFAIEMAAIQATTLGVGWVASQLDDRLAWVCHVRRTAPPRQQSLEIMLDWSYKLLGSTERTLFQRLGMFRGDFSLAAAMNSGHGGGLTRAEVVGAIGALVEKSLVMATTAMGDTHYRLLETTQMYALKKFQGRDKGA